MTEDRANCIAAQLDEYLDRLENETEFEDLRDFAKLLNEAIA